MDAIVVSLCLSQTSLTINTIYKTLKFKNPFPTRTQNLLCLSSLSSSSSSSSSSSPKPYLKPHFHPHKTPQKNSTKPQTLLVESLNETKRLKDLVNKLNEDDSNPLEILRDEGDWSNDQFWTVIRFLKETSRSKEVLQVFDMWKNLEKTLINEVNYYEKIISLLGEEGLMEEAVSTLEEMKEHGLSASLKVYNSLILGFACKGEFESVLTFLNEMAESNLRPGPEMYNRLIQSYGYYQMYDEISKCVKRMESEGCLPSSVTYNLLIVEFARGGLLKRMERAYQTMLSKRMDLQSSTLIAMLEAYTDIGILEKMERVYRRVLNTRVSLSESLIRKIAGFYIKNLMFSRLDDFGIDIASRYGKKDLVWCIRLLSPACLLSKKGMDSTVREMEVANFPWNATVLNIMALAYLKMKDFKQLDILLSQLQTRDVKPDIVTVGILLDANASGFRGRRTLELWRRMGLLEEAVEMNTDPLVLTAFGKGCFLRSCEEMYSSIEAEVRENRVWTYCDFVDSVFKHK